MATLSPTPTPGYECETSDASLFGLLVCLALLPFTVVLLWRTYLRKKDKGSSILVQLLCDRPRFVMVTVYSVVLVLGISAIVDACGGAREISVDADLQAYIRCDHRASTSYDALAIAREEIALTSSCGVRRRRLSSASPAIDEWPPRSRSRRRRASTRTSACARSPSSSLAPSTAIRSRYT